MTHHRQWSSTTRMYNVHGFDPKRCGLPLRRPSSVIRFRIRSTDRRLGWMSLRWRIPAIRSRRFVSSRLSYGCSNLSSPLKQDLDGVAKIALRRGPIEGHPLPGSFLERLGAGGHGLLKVLCPALPSAQSRKGAGKVALRLRPVEGHPLPGALLERFGEGGHGLLKALCPNLPLAQGRKVSVLRSSYPSASPSTRCVTNSSTA